MENAQNKAENIDQFIAEFPEDVQAILQKVRSTIKSIIPNAEECINYGIPTFKLKENVVHFSGYKNHIGFYPGSGVIAKFAKEIAAFKNAKGSVQFPLNQEIPYELIQRMTEYRLEEMALKSALKKKK